METRVRRPRFHLALGLATGLVIALGVFAQLAVHTLPEAAIRRDLLTLLSLSYEGNLPTWYSATLLALCGAVLTIVAAAAQSDRWRWWLLAAGFFYISLDETVGIHEAVDAMFENTTGIFYFGWVLPAAVIVLILAIIYAPFVRRLPPASRRRFVLAGVVYVTGALILELPLGLWTEHAGNDNLVYSAIDLVEESLEMIGASLFLAALVDHLCEDDGAHVLRLVQP